MADVICAVDSKNTLGEGPVWCPVEQALYWVDIDVLKPSINRWYPATNQHERWDMPEYVTALALREQGGLLVAGRSGLSYFDPQTGDLKTIVHPDADNPQNRYNDGKCDCKGRFWVGSMQNNMDDQGGDIPITENSGSLFRLDPDGTCQQMDTGFGISNTFAWSLDNKTMYFGDSLDAIYAYDFDFETGSIGNRRDFFRLEERGVPDGSTIDAEGYLWNARWDGHCIVRIAPDGTLDRVIDMPAQKITSCMFGGANLDVLYMTSARQGLTDRDLVDQPEAGGIFAVDVGVRGLPEARFGG